AVSFALVVAVATGLAHSSSATAQASAREHNDEARAGDAMPATSCLSTAAVAALARPSTNGHKIDRPQSSPGRGYRAAGRMAEAVSATTIANTARGAPRREKATS